MNEQTAAALQSGYTAHMLQVWGEEPETESLYCQSCGAEVTELLPCTWDAGLLVGKCCVEEPGEECQCRLDGDMADASDCRVHGSFPERMVA